MILFLRAILGLLAYDILTTFFPFKTFYRIVRGWKVSARQWNAETVDRVCTAANYGFAWYPKRALCLQRAFVTTYLLRRNGVPAQMVLGAQRMPFAAHSWVEVEGRAVNERSNVQAIYLVWDKC